MNVPFDPNKVPSPCFVISAERLRDNGRILRDVAERSGAKILLAQKAFAMPSAYPILRPYLDGTTASSVSEALLGALHMDKEVHAYSVAYSQQDMERICTFCSHVIFNSVTQWKRFTPLAQHYPEVEFGIRINPNYSEVEVEIYNPCQPHSRFGMTKENLQGVDLEGIRGFHVHTLCEQGFGPLERMVEVLEKDFADHLHRLSWLNLGGGHFITKPDYDRTSLIHLIRRLRQTYDLDIILEPGEAVVQETGWLVADVLDVFCSQGVHHAICNVSATAHMPDVLEMPYHPELVGAGSPGERAVDVMVGGNTCLSGDRIGMYSFDTLPDVGDRFVFTDMAMYTMVKSSHFNGVPHPSIGIWDHGTFTLHKSFSYQDVRNRLG